MAKNELPDDAPDELSNLLIDRDTCERAVVVVDDAVAVFFLFKC